MGRRAAKIGILLIAVAAGIGVARRQRPLPAEEGVSQAVETFCRSVEEWRLDRALKIVSVRFEGEGFSKHDLTRGLIDLRREYDRLGIYIAALRVWPSPDGLGAEAEVEVALTAWRGMTVVSVGQDAPVRVTAWFEREGRHWRVVRTEGLPALNWGL